LDLLLIEILKKNEITLEVIFGNDLKSAKIKVNNQSEDIVFQNYNTKRERTMIDRVNGLLNKEKFDLQFVFLNNPKNSDEIVTICLNKKKASELQSFFDDINQPKIS